VKDKYGYETWQQEEITRVIRGLFQPGVSLKPATLAEDFGGTDCHYIVNNSCPLQLRARFNRPAFAADSDVTFRVTEPAMMLAGTYAPLALFVWFHAHHIVAGRLIDIYRLFNLQPWIEDRPLIPNKDGSRPFYQVTIGELHNIGALLRIYDGNVWATATLGGEARLNTILRQRKSP